VGTSVVGRVVGMVEGVSVAGLCVGFAVGVTEGTTVDGAWEGFSILCTNMMNKKHGSNFRITS